MYSIFGSLAAYWAVNHFWHGSVHKEKQDKQAQRKIKKTNNETNNETT
jgi:hypothetical protein